MTFPKHKISYWMFSVYAAFVIVPASMAATPDQHYKLMEIYTHMASAAFFAEKNCPGIKADRAKLLVLRSMAKISDAEEAMIDENIKAIVSEIRMQFEKTGRLGWCSDAFTAFGPDGRLMRGLISR